MYTRCSVLTCGREYVTRIALTALFVASCSLDSSPATQGTTTNSQGAGGKAGSSSKLMPTERPMRPMSAAMSAVGSLGSNDLDASTLADAAHVSIGEDKQAPADDDAGAEMRADASLPTKDAGALKDAGSGQQMPGSGPTVTMPQSGDPECTRAKLREKADLYLQAMASDDPSMLRLHPKVRFTQDGQEQPLGAGVWSRHAKATFARHALDESRCSTLTQALLSAVTGRILLGARLLYADGQLLEVETQTVAEGTTLLANLDAIAPVGSDPWVDEVPSDVRMTREKLTDFGQQYLDAATGGGMVPASTPDCKRRQNGVPMAENGSCAIAPGTSRFEQRHFAVVDDVAGIATATVLYQNHLGFYLFKMFDGKIQNIEVIGGNTATSSGW